MASDTAKFQSYLYGIEIVAVWNPKTGSETFQSYLYGIEMLIVSLLLSLMGVSIVPLWN